MKNFPNLEMLLECANRLHLVSVQSRDGRQYICVCEDRRSILNLIINHPDCIISVQDVPKVLSRLDNDSEAFDVASIDSSDND